MAGFPSCWMVDEVDYAALKLPNDATGSISGRYSPIRSGDTRAVVPDLKTVVLVAIIGRSRTYQELAP